MAFCFFIRYIYDIYIIYLKCSDRIYTHIAIVVKFEYTYIRGHNNTAISSHKNFENVITDTMSVSLK